jgi:hypothetical protein
MNHPPELTDLFTSSEEKKGKGRRENKKPLINVTSLENWKGLFVNKGAINGI